MSHKQWYVWVEGESKEHRKMGGGCGAGKTARRRRLVGRGSEVWRGPGVCVGRWTGPLTGCTASRATRSFGIFLKGGVHAVWGRRRFQRMAKSGMHFWEILDEVRFDHGKLRITPRTMRALWCVCVIVSGSVDVDMKNQRNFLLPNKSACPPKIEVGVEM